MLVNLLVLLIYNSRMIILFMNHHLGEHYHVNHDTIDHNSESKRRVIGFFIPPPIQASTSYVDPHVAMMNAQSNVAPQ